MAAISKTSENDTDTVGPVSVSPINVSYATLMALGSRRDVAGAIPAIGDAVCSVIMSPGTIIRLVWATY